MKLGKKYPRRHWNKAFFSHASMASCYWGGFIAADGTIDHCHSSIRVRLAEKDRGHLQSLAKEIEYDGNLITNSATNSVGLQLYNAQSAICDLENFFNIVPNKSISLRPPLELEMWPVERKKAYLVGYIDGDGCIRYDKRDNLLHLDIFSGSSLLVRWAKWFLEEEYSLPSKKIFESKGGRGYLYRLIGKRAELVREDLRTTYQYQLRRKWDCIAHPRSEQDV
jgi:hypothetical protein